MFSKFVLCVFSRRKVVSCSPGEGSSGDVLGESCLDVKGRDEGGVLGVTRGESGRCKGCEGLTIGEKGVTACCACACACDCDCCACDCDCCTSASCACDCCVCTCACDSTSASPCAAAAVPVAAVAEISGGTGGTRFSTGTRCF